MDVKSATDTRGPTAAINNRPHLLTLSPTSAALDGGVVTIKLTATGLTPTGNTVFFGPMKLGQVGSADGKALSFAMPETLPSTGEVPPMSVQPGRYGVYIVNANGTSDTLTFTIR